MTRTNFWPHNDTYVPPAAEATANTTPLVLENVFFPLGKEPRQFDAFYLGSKEAFSKPKARATLCFNVAEPRFAALSVLRSGTMAISFWQASALMAICIFSASTPQA